MCFFANLHHPTPTLLEITPFASLIEQESIARLGKFVTQGTVYFSQGGFCLQKGLCNYLIPPLPLP
jgi:hypothetical protein